MQVIRKNAVKIVFVLSKFYGTSSRLSSFMFFQYRYLWGFLIAITQFNNVLLYVGRETTFKVSNQWVSRCTEWNFLLCFSDSAYMTHVNLKRVTTMERYEWCPSILLWINNGNITSRNHQVPTFFLKLKLFSFCFRLCYNIINEANGCEHDICSLRKISICFFDVV